MRLKSIRGLLGEVWCLAAVCGAVLFYALLGLLKRFLEFFISTKSPPDDEDPSEQLRK